MYELTITQGDLAPDIEITVLDENGAPVDVTNAGIKLTLWSARNPTLKIVTDGTGEVVDGPAGKIAYRWQSGQTATPGTYEGEFLITPPIGDPIHCPTDGRIIVFIESAGGG